MHDLFNDLTICFWKESRLLTTFTLITNKGNIPKNVYVACCVDGTPVLMEYALCQSEYLRVKCGFDEVIVVEHARYGRMSISRCVKQDFGFVGCSVDVLPVLDTHCSGRRACSVRVLDDNFDNVKPCHDDLKSYLEVSYRCIKGLVSLLFHS